ncbi:MAG: ABC transporter substrate-binding protein [Azoarcus sp.]|jgi:sulfonate transport system substrate-binding protein|nr:ABC transporter substrate-binding protein [Azoarcus sp.]
MKKLFYGLLGALTLGLSLAGGVSSAAENPKELRIAISSAGVGGKPKFGGSWVANVHLKGLVEREFEKDGIKVVWYLFPGAGPATNEAFSNKKVDFGLHGDLPMIVGRATGLKHKIIIATGRFGPLYFVVPSGSTAKTIADLKGQKIGSFKGTNQQLVLSRLLKRNGLAEKDFRVINLDGYASRTSLATGDIGGTITSPWSLEARGVAKRILEVRDDKFINTPVTIWVGEEFEAKYPQIVQRFVNVLVKEAHWSSLEENREEQFRLWTQSGNQYADYKNDWEGYALKDRHSPLLDEYYISTIKKSVEECKEFKLIRKDVTVDDWIEPKYLNTALKELGLENFWPRFDAQGKQIN